MLRPWRDEHNDAWVRRSSPPSPSHSGVRPRRWTTGAAQPAGWDDAIRLPAATDLNPDPGIVELEPGGARRAAVAGSRGTDAHVDLQRPRSRAADPRARRRSRHRPLHEQPARGDDDPLARAAHSRRDGRHAGPFPAADSTGRQLRLRLRRARRVHVLVPPAHERPRCRRATASTARSSSTIRRSRPAWATRSSWCSATSISNDDGSLQPADGGGDLGTLFGREGNVLLVNGKVRPTLKARPGLRQRWRFINAAKSRYFQIALDGHTFTPHRRRRRSADGARRRGAPVLAPGERVDLLVVPDGAGGHGAGRAMDRLRSRVTAARFNRPPAGSVRRAARRRARRDAAAARHRSARSSRCRPPAPRRSHLSLTYAERSPFQLGINGVAVQGLRAADGRRRRDAGLDDHEHHRVRPPVPPARLLLPGARAAPGRSSGRTPSTCPSTARSASSSATTTGPGMWMFHCHILDHAEAGMMGC